MNSRWFTTIESRQRIKAFDRTQEQALAELDGVPSDDRFWGNYRSILRATIANAFLPNVRHNEVLLPYEQRQTNNSALLPVVVPEDAKLTLSSDLRDLTPHTKEKYMRLGSTAIQHDKLSLEVSMTQWAEDTGGMTKALSVTHATGTIFGRAIVMTERQRSRPALIPAITVHEFVHAVDTQRWQNVPDIHNSKSDNQAYLGAMEVHAYAVTSVLPSITSQAAGMFDQYHQVWIDHGYSHDAMPVMPTDLMNELIRQNQLGYHENNA